MKEPRGRLRAPKDEILLAEAKEALAYCRSAEELCQIAHIHLDRLFPDARACIYLADENGTRFVAPQICECQKDTVSEFRHYECWAICRGTAHAAGSVSDSSPCGHVKTPETPFWRYLCLPLYAGSRILGLLHIEHMPKKGDGHDKRKAFHDPSGLRLLSRLAQEVATLLASLKPAGT